MIVHLVKIYIMLVLIKMMDDLNEMLFLKIYLLYNFNIYLLIIFYHNYHILLLYFNISDDYLLHVLMINLLMYSFTMLFNYGLHYRQELNHLHDFMIIIKVIIIQMNMLYVYMMNSIHKNYNHIYVFFVSFLILGFLTILLLLVDSFVHYYFSYI